jgi:ABC-type transport system involved in multi-copper enzyme maturation permease subunit
MTQATRTVPISHYRMKHVAKSEAVKILSLRSTAIILGITVVAALLVTALEAHGDLHHVPGWYAGFDPTQESLSGLIVALLTAGVFGALAITGEYSSGTIRTTLTATPRRAALLAAKTGVTAVATVVFCELLSLASFWLGQAILSGGGAPHANLGSPGALRAVTMTGLFIALVALMSFGFGLVLRSTAGAIAAFAGVVFVLPVVVQGISERYVRYTPAHIVINSITATVRPHGAGLNPVSPAVGLALMALYASIALIAGAVLFVLRDA